MRINREADQRFAEINDKYRDAVLKPMSDLGLFVENKGSSTNKDWLLSSWRLGAVGALGSHVPAPITQAGAFADLKVHESAINTLIARMELGGKTLSVGEMRDMIEEKINRPGALGEGENDDSIICLSDRNPIVVGFLNGKIRIALSIELLKTRDWSFRHITVTVHYKTDSDKITGEPYLVRDGAISVSGMVKVRDRIPIYAVFNKIFPEQRVIPLTPETIRHDPRFEGLTTGMCRLSDGWFAIALVAEPENPAKARTTNQTVQSP